MRIINTLCVMLFLFFYLIKMSVAYSNVALRVAVPSLNNSLNPKDAWHYVHYEIIELICQKLVMLDASGNIYSDLSEKWLFSEDKKELTFYLKKNLKFNDGSYISSYDIALSISKILDPSVQNPVGATLREILIDGAPSMRQHLSIHPGIIVLNEKMLKFKLKKPYNAILKLLSNPSFAVFKYGSPGKSNEFVGSGAYNYRFLDKKTLELNPKEGKSAKLTFFQVDEDELISLIKSGKIDIALGFASEKINSYALPKSYVFSKLSTMGTFHLYYNTNQMHDVELRRELAYLLQQFRDLEKKNILLSKVDNYFPRSIMLQEYYQNYTAKPIGLDEFKSKWGKWFSKNKTKFYFRKEYLGGDFKNKIKVFFSNISNNISVEFVDINKMKEIALSGDYSLMQMAYFGTIVDPDGFLTPVLPKAYLPYGKFENKILYKKIEQARYIVDERKRLEAYQGILAEFEMKANVVPYFEIHYPVIYSKRIKIDNLKFRFANFFNNIQVLSNE